MTATPTDPWVRILLVEDDLEDIEVVRWALQDGPVRNELHTAGNAAEALDFLRGKGKYHARAGTPLPDLILLDLHLPGLGGAELLEQLRADPALRQLPVVVVAGSRNKEDMARCYGLGVKSYIVKPTSVGQYARAIQATALCRLNASTARGGVRNGP